MLSSLARVAIFAVLATIVCACVETGYLREGPGTSLYSAGLSQATRDQDAYLSYICQQAGFGEAELGCAVSGARGWEIFVQAGLNDVDRRCDAYLSWLDDQRRSRGPTLQQISDLRTATAAIMTAAGSGVAPIAIAAASFGLASSSFSNFQSRLVMEVNQSTVQTIVLSAQQRLRDEIRGLRIDNQPAAIYVLRQYLRVCTPFYIEAQINTTITAFERGGPDAAAMQAPLASVLRESTIGLGPIDVRPVKANAPIEKRARPTGPAVPAFGGVLWSYDPRTDTPLARRALEAICARGRELEAPGELTKALIAVYEDTPPTEANLKPTADGKLSTQELEMLQARRCGDGLGNYYEATSYPDGLVTSFLASLLNRVLDRSDQITPGAQLQSIRSKIAAARKVVGSSLRPRPLLSNTVTYDLVIALSRAPAVPGEKP